MRVRVVAGASRRTKNHVSNGGMWGRVVGDRVLLVDVGGRPLAWVPVDEVERVKEASGE
jgi:hypothetical protein